MEKLMIVLTTVGNKYVALSKVAIAAIEPEGKGSKVITTLVTSPYESHVKNVEYHVQESVQYIIDAINK